MTKTRLWTIMAVLMMVEMLSSFENSMTIMALPTIAREFNDIAKAGWLITGFVLIQAGTAAIGGRLGDMFGRRKVLAIIALACSIGSLVSALSTNLEVMIAGRAIQGISGAILPLCFGIAREVAPKKDVPFWVGCLSGAYAVAAGLGHLLAGFLVDIGGWHWIFFFTTGYGLIAIVPLLLFVPETKLIKQTTRIDYLGGLLFVPAVAAVIFGFGKGNDFGWLSAPTLGLIGGGFATLAFWFWYEARQEQPLIDVKLLARKEVALANACYGLLGLGMVQMPIVSMLLLQQPVAAGVGLGIAASVAGVLKIPTAIGSGIASPLSGWVSARFGGRWTVMLGASVGMAGWGFITFVHDSVPLLIAGMVVGVFAIATLLAAVPNIVLEHVPLERSSEATGLSQVMKGIFAGIGAQMMASILASSQVLDPVTGKSFPSDLAYQWCFGITAATAAAILLLGVLIPGRRPGETHEPAV